MLEPRRQIANGASDLRVDGVFLAARWRRMLGFVKNEQRAGAERAEPITQKVIRRLFSPPTPSGFLRIPRSPVHDAVSVDECMKAIQDDILDVFMRQTTDKLPD